MHIIFPPFPFLFFIFSQENMAAVHTCFVPRLLGSPSLEVVSRTGRREVEVSKCASLPGRGSLWVLEGGRLLYVLACSWLWALQRVISSLWCEADMFSLSQTSLGNATVKLVFWCCILNYKLCSLLIWKKEIDNLSQTTWMKIYKHTNTICSCMCSEYIQMIRSRDKLQSTDLRSRHTKATRATWKQWKFIFRQNEKLQTLCAPDIIPLANSL